MQPTRRRSAATKRRRASHAASLRKYTEEERHEAERKHPAVDREAFEEVVRRLVTAPRQKKGPR